MELVVLKNLNFLRDMIDILFRVREKISMPSGKKETKSKCPKSVAIKQIRGSSVGKKEENSCSRTMFEHHCR